MVKIVPFFSVEGLVQLYQLGKVVSLAIDGAARRSEKMRLKFLRSLRPPPKSPSGDFQKSFRTSSSFPPAIRWVCDLYCTQDVGQFPMAIFFFVKLRATGPKFNYCCGGLVPCDMLQWATWLYKVVCCGPLGQGGGGCVCMQHARIRVYAPGLVLGNDSRRIYSSGNVCLL